MTIELRQYQKDIIAAVREAAKQHNSVVMVLPTGAGKTLTTGWIMARVAEKGKRGIFCVHRVELIAQTAKAFSNLGIDYGFIASGEPYDATKQIHIASIDTLRLRLNKVLPPDLLVVDEAHRSVCATWHKVIKHYANAKKLLITATPQRLDGKGLSAVADCLVQGVTTKWLIDNGFLAPYKVYAAKEKPDLRGVRTTAGDYNGADLYNAMSGAKITGDAIKHYQKIASDKQAIVFAINIEHSMAIVSQFIEAGIQAEHLDGTTPKQQRNDIVARFREGKTKVLSNVNLFTEGFDVPNADCCIMLRPTKSLSMYLQMAGRVLRPVEGKTAIILDHAGNTFIHGFIDDQREWNLQGKAGYTKDRKPPITECEACGHLWNKKPAQPTICPACGHEKEIKKREINQDDGELEELQLDKWRKSDKKPLRTILQQAKTIADLHAIRKANKYHIGWVKHAAKHTGITQ